MKTCLQCEFRRPSVTSNDVSICLRYPPVPAWNGEIVIMVYAVVPNTDWCGEFKECTKITNSDVD